METLDYTGKLQITVGTPAFLLLLVDRLVQSYQELILTIAIYLGGFLKKTTKKKNKK